MIYKHRAGNIYRVSQVAITLRRDDCQKRQDRYFPHDAKRRSEMRHAFTLIELVIVIVIMGLLATLAVLSLGGTMDRYQLSRAAETIELFDARARRDARTARRPIQATIRRNHNRLLIATPKTRVGTQFRLPRRVEIKAIRMRRRVTASGDFEIQFNGEGWSPTYALELQHGKISRWLVVLGASGQVITLENEGEVNEILAL